MIDDLLGVDWLTATVDGQAVPASKVGPVTIRHGRATVDDPATAGTCSLALHADALPTLPDLGAYVTVELSEQAATALGMTPEQAAAARVRFAGDVTDSRLIRAVGDPATDAYLLLVLVGPIARLARDVRIGDTPWPDELDGARAGRILTAAQAVVDIPVGTVDPGTVTVLARDIDAQPPLDLLAALAVDSRGQLHVSRAGALSWHDAEHRRGATPVAEPGDAHVLRPDWLRDLRGVVNDVQVGYGAPPGTDDPPPFAAAAIDQASVDRRGRLRARLQTRLRDQVDADRLADDLVGRRARPLWRIDRLTVDLFRTLEPAQRIGLLTAEPGALVRVTGFPAWSPAHSARFFLEGWVESISRRSWTVTYDAVPYSLLGASMRWAEVDPAVRWTDVPRDLTWAQAVAWHTG